MQRMSKINSEMKVLERKKGIVYVGMGILAIFLCIWLVELKAIYWGALNRPIFFSPINSTVFILYFLIVFISLFAFLLLLLFPDKFRLLIIRNNASDNLRWVLVIILGLFPVCFFSFSDWGSVFISPMLRLGVFASIIFLATCLLTRLTKTMLSFKSFLIASILTGSVFLIGDKLKEVVNYPFILYWSEGNRFWDYSVLFARDKYLYPANQPIFTFIDLGRQSLWGLPFLIKNPPISLLRFWNVILFTIPTILLGYILFKNKALSVKAALLLGLWAFLFLNLGPIYSPLILSAILVVVAVNLPLGWMILIMMIAGYYANLTRYTWSFAPAIWGVLLTLFYSKNEGKLSLHINWLKVFTSGLAGLVGGFLLPVLLPLTNNGATQEIQQDILSTAQTTLQTQSLIWSRLLPNQTFPPGIVFGLLLVILPLILVLIIFVRQSHIKLNKLQLIAIASSSTVFLLVGLIASVKIGGGSNLHNLDMLLINLLLMAGLAWKFGAQEWLINSDKHSPITKLLLVFMLLYPLYPTLLTASPLKLPSLQDQKNTLAIIQKSVKDAKEIGEVLFIDQRQLLTFGQIKDVPLVPDYEKKYLMNEAMSSNQTLFNKFYQDLRNHRFALLINEPTFIDYQAEDYYFGSENDAWVKWVAQPLLCFYRPLYTFKNMGVEILIPRITPPDPSWQCP
jgi:hypothetical protein